MAACQTAGTIRSWYAPVGNNPHACGAVAVGVCAVAAVGAPYGGGGTTANTGGQFVIFRWSGRLGPEGRVYVPATPGLPGVVKMVTRRRSALFHGLTAILRRRQRDASP